MLTILKMQRSEIITKEAMKKYSKGEEDMKDSVNDDLESLFENLRLGKEIDDKNVYTYFLPKLTEDEQELSEEEQEETEEEVDVTLIEEPTKITATEINQLPIFHSTRKLSSTKSRDSSPECKVFPPHPSITHYGSTDSLPLIKDKDIIDRHNTVIIRSLPFRKCIRDKQRQMRLQKEEERKKQEAKKSKKVKKRKEKKEGKEIADMNDKEKFALLMKTLSP